MKIVYQKNNIQIQAIDISPALKGYKNLWVALSPDRKKVIASSKTLKSTLVKAKKAGEDKPLVLKAPENFGNYILYLS